MQQHLQAMNVKHACLFVKLYLHSMFRQPAQAPPAGRISLQARSGRKLNLGHVHHKMRENVLVTEVNDRWFALAFGPGGRLLLKNDISDERFGLLCALNSVDPKTFRCVNVQSLDAIQSHTRIQSGQEQDS